MWVTSLFRFRVWDREIIRNICGLYNLYQRCDEFVLCFRKHFETPRYFSLTFITQQATFLRVIPLNESNMKCPGHSCSSPTEASLFAPDLHISFSLGLFFRSLRVSKQVIGIFYSDADSLMSTPVHLISCNAFISVSLAYSPLKGLFFLLCSSKHLAITPIPKTFTKSIYSQSKSTLTNHKTPEILIDQQTIHDTTLFPHSKFLISSYL